MNTSMPIGPIPHGPDVPRQGIQASWRVVSRDYLPAIGVPLRSGRLFDRSRDPRRPIILSEGLARQLWRDGSDPVGRQVWTSGGDA